MCTSSAYFRTTEMIQESSKRIACSCLNVLAHVSLLRAPGCDGFHPTFCMRQQHTGALYFPVIQRSLALSRG
eukprot:c22429_g1_i2 orf=109-324(+)